jgi:nucleoid-associated protein YgaU
VTPPAPAPTSKYADVVVQAGDTLTSIAQRYPDPGITAQSIAAANVDRYPGLKTNQNLIQVGWVLRIR